MPPGVSYRLECALESPIVSADRARFGSWTTRETPPTVKVGEAAVGVEMACGELRFATSTADPFRMLRRPIVTRFDGPAGLKDQFVMLLAESAQPGLGSRVLIEALLKQCLVMLLRRQVEGNDAELSWTAGRCRSPPASRIGETL